MRSALQLLTLAALTVLLAACTRGAVLPNAITYAVEPLNNSGVNGTVTFEKVSDTETLVTIELDETSPRAAYPAHIHVGDIADNGDVYVPLNPVSATTGISETTVTETIDGEAVDFEHLVNFDGYVNLHDPENPATVFVAAGETGAGANDIQIEPRSATR